MLTGIPRKDESGSIGFHQIEDCLHLPGSDLSGFIDDDDVSLPKVRLEEKFADGFCFMETVTSQVHDLLALWGDHVDISTCLEKLLFNGTQGVAFSGTRATPKKGHQVAR